MVTSVFTYIFTLFFTCKQQVIGRMVFSELPVSFQPHWTSMSSSNTRLRTLVCNSVVALATSQWAMVAGAVSMTRHFLGSPRSKTTFSGVNPSSRGGRGVTVPVSLSQLTPYDALRASGKDRLWNMTSQSQSPEITTHIYLKFSEWEGWEEGVCAQNTKGSAPPKSLCPPSPGTLGWHRRERCRQEHHGTQEGRRERI